MIFNDITFSVELPVFYQLLKHQLAPYGEMQ